MDRRYKYKGGPMGAGNSCFEAWRPGLESSSVGAFCSFLLKTNSPLVSQTLCRSLWAQRFKRLYLVEISIDRWSANSMISWTTIHIDWETVLPLPHLLRYRTSDTLPDIKTTASKKSFSWNGMRSNCTIPISSWQIEESLSWSNHFPDAISLLRCASQPFLDASMKRRSDGWGREMRTVGYSWLLFHLENFFLEAVVIMSVNTSVVG